MTNVTRAKVTLIEHDKQSCNTMASQDAVEFISQMEKGKASVRQLLQSEWRRKQIIGEDSYFQFPLMEQQIAPIKSSFL
jgi:hypothetical protein